MTKVQIRIALVGQAGHRVDALALAYRLEEGADGEGVGERGSRSCGLGRYRANSHGACSGDGVCCLPSPASHTSN